MISPKNVQAFITVARCQSFADAAERMHLSQPALSAAIKKLEQQLGGALFNRSTRKVVLSVEGKEFLPIAQRLLSDWEESMSDIQHLFALSRGTLTLAAMPSFATGPLPKILAQFHQEFSNIKLRIVDVVMESVIDAVREGKAEVGFTFEHEQLQGLEFEPLFEDDFVLALPANHALVNSPGVEWSTLESMELVSMNRGSSVRRWVDEYTQSMALSIDYVGESGQLNTLGELVAAGVGGAVVPAISRGQMESRGVVFVPLISPLKKRVGMICSTQHGLSAPAKHFWNMVKHAY